jgi:hypothetical protein
LTFRPAYLVMAAALFAVLLLIARFVDDSFVRPYLANALAVDLMYLGLRGVTRMSVPLAAAFALTIAFAIEISQYFHVLVHLGLWNNGLARAVFGGHFEVRDLCSYTAGALGAVAVEWLRQRRVR